MKRNLAASPKRAHIREPSRTVRSTSTVIEAELRKQYKVALGKSKVKLSGLEIALDHLYKQSLLLNPKAIATLISYVEMTKMPLAVECNLQISILSYQPWLYDDCVGEEDE